VRSLQRCQVPEADTSNCMVRLSNSSPTGHIALAVAVDCSVCVARSCPAGFIGEMAMIQILILRDRQSSLANQQCSKEHLPLEVARNLD
jgi:hypothetical protein